MTVHQFFSPYWHSLSPPSRETLADALLSTRHAQFQLCLLIRERRELRLTGDHVLPELMVAALLLEDAIRLLEIARHGHAETEGYK